MRPLILFFSLLLMSAMCGCRSARQSVSESVDSAKVEIKEVKSALSAEEILSLNDSSRELDLSGITVEFYPADSNIPDARPLPRLLTIENAKTKEQSKATAHQVAVSKEADTVYVALSRSSAMADSSRADYDMLRASDWVVFFSILAAIVILSIVLLFKLKRQ